MKIVRKEKKYKIQRKKTVCEIVNFDSTKLTKKKKKPRKTTNGRAFS